MTTTQTIREIRARMDAYVVSEVESDPFKAAVARLNLANDERQRATQEFLAASRSLRAELSKITGDPV